MASFSVFCELKEDHVLVYRSDGTTRVDHGIYNIVTGKTCSMCGSPMLLEIQGELNCFEDYLHNSLKDVDGVYQLGHYYKKNSEFESIKNDKLSKDILNLKSKPSYAIPIAKAMFLSMKTHFPSLLNVDVIVPVPNHVNDPHADSKAVALAKQLANEYKHAGRPVDVVCALVKTKNSQTHNLSRSDRAEAVKDMFAFNNNISIRGKNTVLVDDVLTAGNIKGQCVSILKKNGADKVWCFVAGRTI